MRRAFRKGGGRRAAYRERSSCSSRPAPRGGPSSSACSSPSRPRIFRSGSSPSRPLKAIDVHAHPSTRPWYESMRPYIEALESYYKSPFHVRTDEEMAEEFLRAGGGGVILAWDAETTTRLPATTNDYVASLRDRFPGAVIGAWASVDPWKGEEAVRELDRAVRTLRLAGGSVRGR